MSSVIGTTGPATPWITRPTMSIGTLTASAEMQQPMPVSASMPISTFLRPARSPKRGRNSENTAHAVKNTVCVRPIWASSLRSWLAIVVRAGDSMDALS